MGGVPAEEGGMWFCILKANGITSLPEGLLSASNSTEYFRSLKGEAESFQASFGFAPNPALLLRGKHLNKRRAYDKVASCTHAPHSWLILKPKSLPTPFPRLPLFIDSPNRYARLWRKKIMWRQKKFGMRRRRVLQRLSAIGARWTNQQLFRCKSIGTTLGIRPNLKAR